MLIGLPVQGSPLMGGAERLSPSASIACIHVDDGVIPAKHGPAHMLMHCAPRGTHAAPPWHCRACLRCAQLRDILAGDKQLADELLYDLKQDERGRAAAAAAAATPGIVTAAVPDATRPDEPQTAAAPLADGAPRSAANAALGTPGQTLDVASYPTGRNVWHCDLSRPFTAVWFAYDAGSAECVS